MINIQIARSSGDWKGSVSPFGYIELEKFNGEDLYRLEICSEEEWIAVRDWVDAELARQKAST